MLRSFALLCLTNLHRLCAHTSAESLVGESHYLENQLGFSTQLELGLDFIGQPCAVHGPKKGKHSSDLIIACSKIGERLERNHNKLFGRRQTEELGV